MDMCLAIKSAELFIANAYITHIPNRLISIAVLKMERKKIILKNDWSEHDAKLVVNIKTLDHVIDVISIDNGSIECRINTNIFNDTDIHVSEHHILAAFVTNLSLSLSLDCPTNRFRIRQNIFEKS